MSCGVSGEQLWSWVDRNAPELAEHIATCPACRARAEEISAEIGLIAADPLAMSSIPLPERIGPYLIKRLIGEGGQAFVYEAEQPDPRRLVALKVLKGGRFASREHIKHFRRETRTLAALNHPAIAIIHEAGRTVEGQYYFTMELVDGVPLHTHVRETKPTRNERLALFRKICEAIQYAHDNGVIHRDLKPSNIMVRADGEPKILDFGLARFSDPALSQGVVTTETGHVKGTPRYMSPEQAMGRPGDITARTDIYSLGIILYELLTGNPPYETESGVTPSTLRMICQEPPRPPSSLHPELRGDLETIILKTLEKDPGDRYVTAKALIRDLDRYANCEPIHARPAGTWERLGRKVRKHPWVAAAAGAVVLVAVLGFWYAGRPDYHLVNARTEVMRLKFELFDENRDRFAYSDAVAAAGKYPDLPEATLVKAHALWLDRQEKGLEFVESELSRHGEAWYLALFKEEMEADPTPTDEATRASWNRLVGSVDDAETWYLGSFATVDRGRAITRAREVVARDPRHRLALEYLGRLLEQEGDLEAALEAATALADLGGLHSAGHTLLGSLLLRVGRHDEASATADRMIAEELNVDGAYKLRAAAHRHRGMYEEAVRDHTRSLELRNDSRSNRAWLHFHRGTPRWICGDTEGAADDFRRADDLLTYPTFANARLYLCLRELGRDGEAAEVMAESRRGAPESPWLREVLACLAGDIAPADLVAGADPDRPDRLAEAYYYAGETCLLQGDGEAARAWFRECLDLGEVENPGDRLHPLSEQELAQWRLDQLLAETATRREP